MNKWIKRVIATLLIASQFVIIPVVSANSSGNTRNQKEKIKIELEQTQKEIDKKLSEVSELSISLDELTKEIKAEELSIAKTEEKIDEQEVLVQERYEYSAEQLKVMQKSEMNQNIIIGLFQSESLSDLINRLYTVSILTSANEDILTEVHEEFEKLNDLKEELVVNKEKLNEKEEETVQQKAVLDEKLTGLKSTLAADQKKLDEINAKEAAKKQSVAKKNKVKTTSSNSSGNSGSSATSSKSSTSKSNSGSWMTFESTGYSTKQAGLSSHTATGINLLVNPRVIAVDPTQIPLGSLVEVEGMGVYVAGDTGGAINGRIIDVHFPTVAQAMSWGRRNVRIKILN